MLVFTHTHQRLHSWIDMQYIYQTIHVMQTDRETDHDGWMDKYYNNMWKLYSPLLSVEICLK